MKRRSRGGLCLPCPGKGMPRPSLFRGPCEHGGRPSSGPRTSCCIWSRRPSVSDTRRTYDPCPFRWCNGSCRLLNNWKNMVSTVITKAMTISYRRVPTGSQSYGRIQDLFWDSRLSGMESLRHSYSLEPRAAGCCSTTSTRVSTSRKPWAFFGAGPDSLQAPVLRTRWPLVWVQAEPESDNIEWSFAW